MKSEESGSNTSEMKRHYTIFSEQFSTYRYIPPERRSKYSLPVVGRLGCDRVGNV